MSGIKRGPAGQGKGRGTDGAGMPPSTDMIPPPDSGGKRPCPVPDCADAHDETLALLAGEDLRHTPSADLLAEREYCEREIVAVNGPGRSLLAHRSQVIDGEITRREGLSRLGAPALPRRGTIPADVVAEVKRWTDIVTLADELGLVVLGRGPKHPFLCPIPDHNDTYPSASVYADTGRWWCHRCNTGGDAIDLVIAVRGLEWRDAVRFMAARAGVAIPETPPSRQGRRRPLEVSL